MSSDGRQIIAAEYRGRLYLSGDEGQSWHTALEDQDRTWASVASAGDGKTLLGLRSQYDSENTGAIHISHDGGKTWMVRERGLTWGESTISADGRVLVASPGHFETGHASYIYTSQRTTIPGPAGSLSGAPGSELELQYLGNNRFRILNASGRFSVNGATVTPSLKAP
jgi:hypothetical protein